MKKIFFTLILISVFSISARHSSAAIVYGLDNSCGTSQLIVYVTPDVDYTGAATAWSPAAFTISWPMTLPSNLLGTISNQNGFGFVAAGAVGNDGTNYYQAYSHTGIASLTMLTGVDYEVARIALNGGTGNFGTLTIPASDNAWVIANNGQSTMNNNGGNQVASTYGVTTISNIPLFAGIFWDGVSWCGGSGTNQQPGPSDAALDCYVNGMGAQLTTPHTTPAVVANLTIATSSQLTIMPGGALTVSNITTINSAQGLVIAADQTGSGSFKNNPVFTNTVYGSGASVTVQTYMKNTATAGSYHMHLIGPTVFDPTILDQTGTGSAFVRLGAFDIQSGETYAYWYRESINNWINIWQPTDSIPRLGGIALSDISGTSSTISLTGKLNTGSILDPTLPSKWDPTITAQGNGTYMFSNPYSCYLSLAAFYGGNTTRLGSNWTFWTHEHENGTWGTWSYDEDNDLWFGTGSIASANGIINPGQGFFAQVSSVASQMRTTSTATTDVMRTHGFTPFIKSQGLYTLKLKASGNFTSEELIIKFREKATNGIDATRDVEKWASMYEEATQIYTTADQAMLTVNALPSLLPGQMVSVPLGFICGADDLYSISAINLESFDPGTEIWLEDLQTGAPWHSLVENPVYEFTAAPGDPENRFVVHFFSTTGIDDPEAQSAIQIYAWQQDAYIVNKGNETVKEYVAYDMMGRELHRGTLPNSTVNRVTIADVSGYYVVKVITKEGRIYTDKVYISK